VEGLRVGGVRGLEIVWLEVVWLEVMWLDGCFERYACWIVSWLFHRFL
jgi:hypothetical protein